jgi:predicted amidohydrolase
VRLLQARAIENQAYVVGVTRVGNDPQYVYNGRSVNVDYHGELLTDAGDREGCISSRFDLNALEKYRAEVPFLADMRQ